MVQNRLNSRKRYAEGASIEDWPSFIDRWIDASRREHLGIAWRFHSNCWYSIDDLWFYSAEILMVDVLVEKADAIRP